MLSFTVIKQMLDCSKYFSTLLTWTFNTLLVLVILFYIAIGLKQYNIKELTTVSRNIKVSSIIRELHVRLTKVHYNLYLSNGKYYIKELIKNNFYSILGECLNKIKLNKSIHPTTLSIKQTKKVKIPTKNISSRIITQGSGINSYNS